MSRYALPNGIVVVSCALCGLVIWWRCIGITARDIMVESRTMAGEFIRRPKQEDRGRQIIQWIEENTIGGFPRYAVIDDERNAFTESDRRLMPIHFTDGKIGLTDQDADAVVALLRSTP